MKIFATKEVFAVWTNTDLTEGRGREYILHVCALEVTANRLAKGKYVMGTDCRITKVEMILMGDKLTTAMWYVSNASDLLVAATDEEIKVENKLKEERAAKIRREKVLEKAKTLGLTDEDIATLRS